MNTDGTVNNNNANNSNGFAPGFYINMGRPINSSGSESSPYIKGGYNLSDGRPPPDKLIPRYGEPDASCMGAECASSALSWLNRYAI